MLDLAAHVDGLATVIPPQLVAIPGKAQSSLSLLACFVPGCSMLLVIDGQKADVYEVPDLIGVGELFNVFGKRVRCLVVGTN